MGKRQGKPVYRSGLFGTGQDYRFYQCSKQEWLLGWLAGFIFAFLSMQILFSSFSIGALSGGVTGFLGVRIIHEHLLIRRKTKLLLQFTDFLSALSTSFSSGKNTIDAFADAHQDMLTQFGAEADIVKELEIILLGLRNNYTIESMLEDFALRTDLEDVENFSNTFSICNRLGGNLKTVVAEAREIITNKISIEMDIETMVTEKKNELNIMVVLPLLIVTMMGSLGNEITMNTPINIAVKLVAIILFSTAYMIGRRIINIKV